jgi:hypothetical protein
MKINDSITLDFHHSVADKKTSCVVQKNNQQFVGIAKCAKGDMFARSVGRKLSLNRVLSKEINGQRVLDREERTAIWNTLRTKGVNLAF